MQMPDIDKKKSADVQRRRKGTHEKFIKMGKINLIKASLIKRLFIKNDTKEIKPIKQMEERRWN